MANTPAFDLDAFGNTPMNCMTLIAEQSRQRDGACARRPQRGRRRSRRRAPRVWFPARLGERARSCPPRKAAPFSRRSPTRWAIRVEYRKDVMGSPTRTALSTNAAWSSSPTAWAPPAKRGQCRVASRTAASPTTCAARWPSAPKTARDGARILMELVTNGATRLRPRFTPSPIRAKPSCSRWRAAATTWARACRTTRSPSCPTTSTCTG